MKTVFVDLEETLIKSWDDPTPINHEKVERFLQEHGRDVEIFSFAIWGQKDLDDFEFLRPILEREFNINIVKVHDYDDIHKAIREFTGVNFETYEISSIWGKARSFEDFCVGLDKENWEFVLLDDTVVDKTVQYLRKNVTIKLVNC